MSRMELPTDPPSIKTKSIHSPIEPGDGLRIHTSRFRGRGITRDRYDVWLPNLGPSEALLKRWKTGRLPWADYAMAYMQEIFQSTDLDLRNRTIKNHGQKFVLRLIKELARRGTVTILCQCPEAEEHCHRHLLKELLTSTFI